MTSPIEAVRAVAEDEGVEYGGGMPGKKVNAVEPEYTRNDAGDYLFTWNDKVTKEIERIKIANPTRSGRDAWVTVSVILKLGDNPQVSIFTNKQWNLTSVSAAGTIATALNKRAPDRNWDGKLALVEQYLAQKVESGGALVDMYYSLKKEIKPVQYAVYPFIVENAANMIGAPGGASKSLAVTAWCLAYTYGLNIMPGIETSLERKATLYLDWEEQTDVMHRWRMNELLKNQNVDMQTGKILYKNMFAPLTDATAEILAIIREYDVGLVVVDSGSKATGGSASEENVVIPFFNAMASWGVTTMTIVHKSKEAIQKGGKTGPSGVVQWWNQARNYWEILNDDESGGDDELFVAFRHDKANHDKLHAPMNYRIDFSDGIKYETDVEVRSEEIRREMPKPLQVELWLRENTGAYTTQQISEGTGMSNNHVGNVMRKLEGKKFYGSKESPRRWMLMPEKQENSEW